MPVVFLEAGEMINSLAIDVIILFFTYFIIFNENHRFLERISFILFERE